MSSKLSILALALALLGAGCASNERGEGRTALVEVGVTATDVTLHPNGQCPRTGQCSTTRCAATGTVPVGPNPASDRPSGTLGARARGIESLGVPSGVDPLQYYSDSIIGSVVTNGIRDQAAADELRQQVRTETRLHRMREHAASLEAIRNAQVRPGTTAIGTRHYGPGTAPPPSP